MGSIGSWMSPSGRMTAACGIGRQLATWLSCARWPSTSSVTAEQPRSGCGRVASRLPGMMSTCCLYWLDDFLRRPQAARPRSACGRVASRLPGMMSTCCLYWLDDFMRRPCGARADRAGLQAALDYVRDGEVLVVWKLDRLGRSLPHLIETVTALSNRGVGFRSLTEALDTTTPGGRLIFHIFGALGQFERDLIQERTRA